MNELEHFATQKGITKDKTLIFYGSNEGDLERVGQSLPQEGIKSKLLIDLMKWQMLTSLLKVSPTTLTVSPHYG